MLRTIGKTIGRAAGKAGAAVKRMPAVSRVTSRMAGYKQLPRAVNKRLPRLPTQKALPRRPLQATNKALPRLPDKALPRLPINKPLPKRPVAPKPVAQTRSLVTGARPPSGPLGRVPASGRLPAGAAKGKPTFKSRMGKAGKLGGVAAAGGVISQVVEGLGKFQPKAAPPPGPEPSGPSRHEFDFNFRQERCRCGAPTHVAPETGGPLMAPDMNMDNLPMHQSSRPSNLLGHVPYQSGMTW